LVTSWWRVMQVGVDIPPLRASMVCSLDMPHHLGCQDPTCHIPECQGNQVEVDEQGRVSFSLVHHKTSHWQQDLLGGPICPSPPPDSITARLTKVVVEQALPLLYSSMDPDFMLGGTSPWPCCLTCGLATSLTLTACLCTRQWPSTTSTGSGSICALATRAASLPQAAPSHPLPACS
jgi:hypothetical protein